jgi:hypothetical protein
MKKNHLLATMKLCLMATVSSALLFTSCAQDGFDEETFETSVRNTQVESPSADKITIKQNSSGTEQIISWPVVLGAGGFECKVIDESDENNPEVIFEKVVDGCSFRAKREDDAKYRIYIHALGNKQYNNTDAASTTEIAYNTIVEPYKTIPSGTDLAVFFKSEEIPENKIDETTKEIVAIAYNLEAGGSYTMSDTISFGNRKVLLYSTKAGADIQLTGEKAMFQIQNGFTLRNLRIDCAGVTSIGLVICSNTPDENVPLNESKYTSAGTKGSYLITEPVEIKNCMIKDLKKALIATGEDKGWVMDALTIMNNIIQMDNETDYFLNFYGGSVSRNSAFKELLIQNNTILNLKANTKQFVIRYGNASNAIKLFGTNTNPEAGRFKWQISNNTLVGVFTGKDFGNNIPNNACVTNIMTDNIFFNVYRLQKFIQGNQNRTYYNNYIWSDGTTNIDATDKSTYCSEKDPGFIAPTASIDLKKVNGGLDLKPSGEVLTSGAGDPRWLK